MTEPTPIQRKPACACGQCEAKPNDEHRILVLREKLQRLLSGAARTNDEILALERRLDRKAA